MDSQSTPSTEPASVREAPAEEQCSEPWGKLDHDASGCVIRSQSLAAHCRDVAAVFSKLIEIPGIAQRLAQLAGRPSLDSTTRARLTYLVHLHDCGKVNSGFQARIDQRAAPVGHIAPLAALFGDKPDPALASRAHAAIGATRLESWGPGVPLLLDAILSHHGRPWPCDDDGRRHAKHWRTTAGQAPIVALAALREDADRFVPEALVPDATPLPEQPAFVHAITGLVQLSDWIASSDWERAPDDAGRAKWAASRLRTIGLDPKPWRASLLTAGVPPFHALFDYQPHEHQRCTGEAEGQLVILEAETGSGKTEAALWRFAKLFAAGAVDGLYFALPTRTAAVQLHVRVSRFARSLWPSKSPAVVLAVPGYLDGDGSSKGGLPPAPEPLDVAEGDARPAMPVWASEHPKRYFAAPISVGTLDQALLAVLRVKHAHLRGAALMRHLLVVDEVHASDAYMRGLLIQLLRDHLAAGGHALLLSATLAAEARQAILVSCAGGRARDAAPPTLSEAVRTPYPLLSTAAPASIPRTIEAVGTRKTVIVEQRVWLDEAEAIAEAALTAAREGAKVLVVRNTVDGALMVQRALETRSAPDEPVLFRAEGIVTLHHGRFAREDRRLLDAAVERAVGRTRIAGGLVVVGTQTLEQSLDIDADLLITDLCPVDVLLQRIGRLHRHAHDAEGIPRARPEAHHRARALVLTPPGGLTPFLRSSRPCGLRRHGLGHRLVNGVPQGVYRDLTLLEATRRLIERHRVWEIPSMNRELVESALHSAAIDDWMASLPDDERETWREHRRRVVGDDLAQSQIARDGVLVRDRPFRDDWNVRFDDALVTRLGANDRLVTLPEATVGPLGHVVRRLSIPDWMVRDVPVDALPELVATSPGLRFHLGDRSFIYDRHGLRPAEDG